MMKKKSFNKKLKLQKENIVNLNQLNLIKGGNEILPTTVGSVNTNDCNNTVRSASAVVDTILDEDLNVFF